jgi:flagellar hook assembly protein FlgD
MQGTNNLLWDGKDASGIQCTNGIYFYKLDTPSQHQVKKLIIAK